MNYRELLASLKNYHLQKLQLREMPEEWEGLPAMAVEVELDLELEDSKKLDDPEVLTFLMDEAVQTFNSKGQYSWVGDNKFLKIMFDIVEML